MRKMNKTTLVTAAAASVLGIYQTTSAQTVIGNWESPLVGSGTTAPPVAVPPVAASPAVVPVALKEAANS